jgi:hypothetical protein
VTKLSCHLKGRNHRYLASPAAWITRKAPQSFHKLLQWD